MKKSSFPGMDPYLEGYLWPDVHNRLAAAIAELAAPQIAPKYVARIELYTVEDGSPASELGIMYPDVEILQRQKWISEPAVVYGDSLVATEPTLVVPSAITVRIPVVEVRDVANNRLITAIEILSPVNKKSPGFDQYCAKRLMLHQSGVHLLEIDLLRRGTRPPIIGSPPADYRMLLTRAGTQKTEIWAVQLPDRLPVLPIPLFSPDPDALLPLQEALDLIYVRSMYELSIDYQKSPPPPELPEQQRLWQQDYFNRNLFFTK